MKTTATIQLSCDKLSLVRMQEYIEAIVSFIRSFDVVPNVEFVQVTIA